MLPLRYIIFSQKTAAATAAAISRRKSCISAVTALSSSSSSSSSSSNNNNTTCRMQQQQQQQHFNCQRRGLATTTTATTAAKKLSEDAVKASIKILSSSGSPFAWEKVQDRNAIAKTFYFANFNQAFAFMTRTALLAEKMDHHPEWFNVYNQVQVTLTTHDCDGVSDNDIAMAKAMEEYASALMPSAVDDDGDDGSSSNE